MLITQLSLGSRAESFRSKANPHGVVLLRVEGE
jgi:hypothetical protein